MKFNFAVQVRNSCPQTTALPPEALSPGSHIDNFVTRECHGFGFYSFRVVSDPAQRIRNTRNPMKPVVNFVAPNDGMTRLIGQLGQHTVVAFVIQEAAQRTGLKYCPT